MKLHVFWRELRPTRELQSRMKTAAVIVFLTLLGVGSVLLVLYCRWGYALHIEIDTQYYLYSSLIQAFAALAGLLLALMGFLYQRIRDRQNAYLEEAVREARSLSLGELPRDPETIRTSVRDWFFVSHRKQIDSVDGLCTRTGEDSSTKV